MLNFLFSKSLLLKNIRGTGGGALGSNRLLLEDGTFLLKEDAAKHLLEQQPALPTLALSFLSGSTLDPRITFSRGSVATMYDSTGVMTYGPNNLVLNSNSFSTSPWAALSTETVTSNNVIDPNGLLTASTLTFAASAVSQIYNNGRPVTAGVNYMVGVWAKVASGSRTFRLKLNDSNNNYYSPDLTATSTWQLFSFKQLAGNTTAVGHIAIANGTDNAGGDLQIYVASLATVTYEATARPQDQVITAGTAYYGPRFDTNPATLAARGLLMEESRTNLILQSQNFADAAWLTAFGTSKVGAAPIAAPDGTFTAYEIAMGATGGAINTAGALYQIFTATAASYTAGFYVRAKTGSSTIRVATSDGVTGTGTANVAITSTAWTFIPYTGILVVGSSNNISVRNNVAGNSGNIYVWGGQCELGSFATSYIPTGATAVTRLGDVAQMTGTNFTSWYNQAAGTFMVDVEPQAASQLTVIVAVNTTTVSDQIGIYKSDSIIATPGNLWTSNATVASTIQAALNSGVDASVRGKIAYAYALNDFALSANGSVVVTDSSGTLPAPTKFNIGCRDTTLQSNGWIREIKYFNTRRYNPELKAYGT